MSHNINRMAYTGAKPWHGLGVEVPQAMTADEALKLGIGEWTVSKQPVCFKNTSFQDVAVERAYAVVRSDTQKALGMVGEYYEPVQPKDCFSFFDAVVQDKLAMYHTVGALGQGERIWALAKLPDNIQVTNQDMIEKYVLLTNSYNGRSPLMMQITPVRVVCQNTLNMALAKAINRFSARHTESIAGKVSEAREQLQIVNQWYRDFEEMSKFLVKKSIITPQVESFLDDMGYDKETAKGKGIREDITELFEGGRGNNLATVKGSAWALWNGFTEYVDHFRSTRITNGFKTQQEARLNSQWFGAGRAEKSKALDLIMSL